MPQKRSPPAALSSKAAMIDVALGALPEWRDHDGTRKSMTRRQRKNLTQAHLGRLAGQGEKLYYSARYSAGYKAATLAMQSTAAGSKQYGTGLWVTENRINKEMLHSPNEKSSQRAQFAMLSLGGTLAYHH